MTQPKFMGGLGFQDFELFNLALLARQSCRILQTLQSLCARLLKAIYFPNSSILTAEVGTHPSQVWRSIIEGMDVLCQGLIRRIGNGPSTRIWTDQWIPRDDFLRPYAGLCSDPPTLVSELIDNTTATWRRKIIDQVFLAADRDAIMGIPVCVKNIEDFCAWNFEKNGIFR